MNSTAEHLNYAPGLTSPIEAMIAVSEDGCVYVLRAKSEVGHKWYYTGRHLSHCIFSAFPFQTLEGARRKADALNKDAILRYEVIPLSADDLETNSAEVM